MTSGEMVTIIAAIGLALTNVVTAWRTGAQVGSMRVSVERSADMAEAKLDGIHELTNSNLTAVKRALATAEARIAKLEAMLEGRL